jgi:hypothetical protein
MKNFLIIMCLTFFQSCGILKDKPVNERVKKVSDDTIIVKKYHETGGLYDRNYEIKILATGEVQFKGKAGGNEIYYENWNISREQVADLVNAFDESGFFGMNNEYGIDAIDVSEKTLSITTNNKEKTVKRLSPQNTAEEKTLQELESLINKTVDAEPRIRKCCFFSDYPSESIP